MNEPFMNESKRCHESSCQHDVPRQVKSLLAELGSLYLLLSQFLSFKEIRRQRSLEEKKKT